MTILGRPLLPPNLKVPHRRPKVISGELGVSFFDVKVDNFIEDMKYALVLKFLVPRPPIDILRQHINRSWRFLEALTISFMDKQHIFLYLVSERDYMHTCEREGRMVVGCSFHLFN